ncbi:MAG: hypothetical protein ACYTF0_04865 [Planctomycetota bacterium]
MRMYMYRLFIAAVFTVSLASCGSSGGSETDNTVQDPTPPSITSTPPRYLVAGSPIDIKLTVSGGPITHASILNQPHWMSIDTEQLRLSGTPTIDTGAARVLTDLTLWNEHGSTNLGWWLAVLNNDSTRSEQTYPATRPPYDAATINDLYDQNSANYNHHEAQNRLGWNLHGVEQAESRNIDATGIDIGIIDGGIDDSYQTAIVYRARPLSELTNTGHGTAMAGYILGYAPKANLHDYPLTITAATALHHLHDHNVAIASMSIMAQANTDGYDADFTAAAAAFIRDGGIICHSIGNSSDRRHDDSLEDGVPSYQLANELSFLADIDGFADLRQADGALIHVQAAVIDNVPDQALAAGLDGVAIRHLRAHLGHARHHGVTVLENGVGATSQATAQLSAMMGLLRQYANEQGLTLNGRQLADIVCATAVDIGELGIDATFGHGLVDLAAALALIEAIADETASLPTVDRGTFLGLDPSSFGPHHNKAPSSPG